MELKRFITNVIGAYQVLVEFEADSEAQEFSEWLEDCGFILFRNRRKDDD